MSSKKIIQNRNSLYVLLPKGDCDLFGFQGGDPVVITYLPGVGFLITKKQSPGEEPVQVSRLLSMKNAIDGMVAEGRRLIKVDVANAREEFRGLIKQGYLAEGMALIVRLPEHLYKGRMAALEDPFPIEDIKPIEVPLETSKKINLAHKRPGRKGGRGNPIE